MPTVSTASLGNLVKIYYDRRMLERLTPQLMFHQFGVKKELPKREGVSIYWHRLINLAVIKSFLNNLENLIRKVW